MLLAIVSLFSSSCANFRLYIHVRRFIEAGYKVGIVRQVEKAALKKAAKSSGPFSRELVELSVPCLCARAGGYTADQHAILGRYTRSTFVNEEKEMDSKIGASPLAMPSGYLLTLMEEPAPSTAKVASAAAQPTRAGGSVASPSRSAGTASAASASSKNKSAKAGAAAKGSGPALDQCDKIRCSLVAVDPTSGDIVWDSFIDDHMRNELETRLVQLRPSEILVPSASLQCLSTVSRDFLQCASLLACLPARCCVVPRCACLPTRQEVCCDRARPNAAGGARP